MYLSISSCVMGGRGTPSACSRRLVSESISTSTRALTFVGGDDFGAGSGKKNRRDCSSSVLLHWDHQFPKETFSMGNPELRPQLTRLSEILLRLIDCSFTT